MLLELLFTSLILILIAKRLHSLSKITEESIFPQALNKQFLLFAPKSFFYIGLLPLFSGVPEELFDAPLQISKDSP
jgi:hypothetical protein